MGNCTSSSPLSSYSSSNTTTDSLPSLSTSQQNVLLKSLRTPLRQELQDCLSTHTLVLQYNQFTPEMILGIRIALAQQQQEQTLLSQPTLIHSLSILHCFWNDIQTIQALCDWIASLQELQELIIVRNTLQGRQQQLQPEHLDIVVQAIRRARARRPGRPLLHKLVVGNEFLTTDGNDAALRALCAETTALHVKCLVPEVNATTSLVRQPHFLQGFLEQGLSDHGTCKLQSLTLQGRGLLNAERWQTLAHALTATAVDHQGRCQSTSTVRHLQIVNNWIMVDTLITLIGPTSPLETLDVDECTTLGDQIGRAQAKQWGDALAQNYRLQVLCLRNLSWTDTLAVPTFLALRKNTTLHTLDVGIWDSGSNQPGPISNLPRAYRVLADVLPHLTALRSLHLDLGFFFSFHSTEFMQCMIRAMQHNMSIVEWMGGKKPGRRRYGPFHDVLLSTCIPRNRAWRAVQRLLSTEPPLPLSVWHSALRHWLVSPKKNRTALFCVIRRLKGESPR